jgi:hypothetical protein
MTTLTMRYTRGDFVVIGPDIEPLKFKSQNDMLNDLGRVLVNRDCLAIAG